MRCLQVDAVVEFTVDETASAESEAAAPSGKTSVGLTGSAGAAQQPPAGPKDWAQSLLSKLPLLAAGESDQAESAHGKSGAELNERRVSAEEEGDSGGRSLLSRLLSWRPFQNASESEERGAEGKHPPLLNRSPDAVQQLNTMPTLHRSLPVFCCLLDVKIKGNVCWNCRFRAGWCRLDRRGHHQGCGGG